MFSYLSRVGPVGGKEKKKYNHEGLCYGIKIQVSLLLPYFLAWQVKAGREQGLKNSIGFLGP